MKFRCIYDDINRAFLSISKVNCRNTLFPIMELIHIEANEGQIIMRSTNLEIIIEVTVNAKVEVKGKFVINYANIGKIVNLVKSEIIDFELIDNMLHISTGKSKIKLQTVAYEDIPHLPVIDQSTSINIEIKRNSLIEAIKQVSFAVANTEIKPEISSIYLYGKDEYIYTVATDTFRLAEYRILKDVIINNSESYNNAIQNIDNSNTDEKKELNLLIPGKSMSLILPILDNLNDETINLENYEDGIMINSKDTIIALRTINGNFPDYTQLFPKEWLGVVSINKSALSANLAATTLFKDSYSHSNIKIKENTLFISTTNNNIGSYESEIDIKNSDQSFEFEASYNSSLLLEGMSKIDGDIIKLNLTTPNKPMFIKSDSDNNFTYIITPLLNR